MNFMKNKKSKVSSKTGSSKKIIPATKSLEKVRRDPLQQYMLEVSRYPLLSPEEEGQVARHYKEHRDKKSAQALVLANLRLVVKIAMEYRATYAGLLDLIQEGNVGLMRAVEKYDVDKKVRFSSYASWWIRAYILKFIIDNFRLVKIGTTQAQKKLFFNLMKEKEKMEKLGFHPTPALLAERLDVKEKEVRHMEIRMGAREMELDAPRSKDNAESARHIDFLESSDTDVEEALEKSELQDMLLKHLEEFTAKLKLKEKKIFYDRLFSEVPKTLQEIANDYGISRERIRQIEEKLIEKMRKFFKEKGMDVDVSQKDSN